MKILVIFFLLFIFSCQSIPKDSFCTLSSIITISPQDVLTFRTKKNILKHNLLVKEICYPKKEE